MMRAKEIAEKLSERAPAVAKHLLPNGKKINEHWVAGDVLGAKGDSLKVCISGTDKGFFFDFATDQGGDLLELWRLNRRISLPAAIKEAARYMGINDDKIVQYRTNTGVNIPPNELYINLSQTAVAYLTNERKLTIETIQLFDIRADDNFISFPYFSDSKKTTLTQIKRLGIKRINGKKNIRVRKDCAQHLFGWHTISENARTVVLTEGELDAMTLKQYGYDALSLPFGGGPGKKQAWLENDFDRLAMFDEIFLCFDNDDVGKSTIPDLIRRLGINRCSIVELPFKDANECLKQGVSRHDINKCFDNATALMPDELKWWDAFLEDVLKRLFPEDGEVVGYHAPFDKTKGKILFRPHELSTWSGINGHGKSQFLGHLALEFVDQGAKVCIASLELLPSILLSRMSRQAAAQERPTKAYTKAIAAYYADKVCIFNVTGKAKANRLLEVFLYAHQRHNVDVFIIDSLMLCGLREDDYHSQKEFIETLVEFKTNYKCHIHLVAHPRKGVDELRAPNKMDIKGTGAVSDLADYNFIVWRNKKKELDIQAAENEGEAVPDNLKTKCDCLWICDKNRNSIWEGKTALWYDKHCFQYLNHQTQKPKKYVQFQDKTVKEVVFNNEF